MLPLVSSVKFVTVANESLKSLCNNNWHTMYVQLVNWPQIPIDPSFILYTGSSQGNNGCL